MQTLVHTDSGGCVSASAESDFLSIDLELQPGRPPKRNLPALISGCYALDKELCVVIVNPTEHEQRGKIKLALKEYGLDETGGCLRRIYPGKISRLAVARNGALSCPLRLPPLTAWVLLAGKR